MTTYLFIGLILLLGVFLVRQRRARAAGEGSPRPATQRVPLRPPRKGAPATTAARTETAATAPPAAREPLPAAAREPLNAARPAPLAEPAMSWSPEDTIVEPGWPLPGEIAGGWAAPPSTPVESTPFPDGAAAPVAVLEWERPQSAPAGPADEIAADDLPSAEEWAMPPFDAETPLDAPAGPPLWLPGDAEAEVPPPSGDHAADESAATASISPTPPAEIAWGTAADAVAADPAPVAAPPESGLVWADEAPAAEVAPEPASVWEPLAPVIEEPVAEDPARAEPLAEEPVAEPMAEQIVAPEPVEEFALTPAPELWDAGALTEADAIASFAPVAPAPLVVEPADDEVPAIPGFGSVTPAPVWPPESLAETLADPVETAAWDLSPAADAPSPHPAAAIPFTRICDRLGVTPRMLVLMRMLAQTPRSVTEQARELGVSRPLIADLCSRLENAGLATREPVPTDRRRILITLTDAGRRLCEETADTPI